MLEKLFIEFCNSFSNLVTDNSFALGQTTIWSGNDGNFGHRHRVCVFLFPNDFFSINNALESGNYSQIHTGVFSAKQLAISNAINILTVALAGLYIARSEGIQPFNILFVIGVIFGLFQPGFVHDFLEGHPNKELKSHPLLLKILESC